MKTLFKLANDMQPAVIFIDEVDSILTKRSEHDHEVTKRLKTEFLVQVDGVTGIQQEAVLIIAATNRPFDLDDAAIRRFPVRIYIDLPEKKERVYMMKNTFKDTKIDIDDN